MSDKDKIQAAIDALEALEGLPFGADLETEIRSVKVWLDAEINHPYNDPDFVCKGCGEKRKEDSSIRYLILRGGYCSPCWMKF